jgi:magnesium chelatase subunit D
MALFPFTAVVGQQLLKDALILNAINPLVGGVLVRGEKGTAKSTLARALGDLLPRISVVPGCPYQCDPERPFGECPHCRPLQGESPLPRTEHAMRFVTLPNNATEDRVCGTLDLEQALQSGARRFEPGLLARVHRGILYIDEVNLLDDHIVDLLLDAAAMGINVVEREGVRMTHPSRFILIGTMNPEEGDLRPQLLDRFGLCVEIEAILEVDGRAEVVRRRLAWERDHRAFAARFCDTQRELAAAIVGARSRLSQVTLEEESLRQIAQLCVQLEIRSHRADIVIAQGAATLAALDGRTVIGEQDIRRAARLALPHRTRRRPFEDSRMDLDQISQAMQPPPPRKGNDSESPPPEQQPSEAPRQEKVFGIGEMAEIKLPEPENGPQRRSAGGRHARAALAGPRGRYVRATLPSGPVGAGDLAVDATVRAAAPHQPSRQAEAGGDAQMRLESQDVRVKVRNRMVGTTVLLVVDASGSMAAGERMRAAKGAALSLLRDAYVRRDRVALIAFRGDGAEVLLQPTDSVELAHQRLHALPTGGRSPLSHGLTKTLELAQQVRRRDAAAMLLAVLISDGKANVARDPAAGETPFQEAVSIAKRLSGAGIRLLVLDTEDDFLTLGLARELAESAGADYVKLSDLEAAVIERAVRVQLNAAG